MFARSLACFKVASAWVLAICLLTGAAFAQSTATVQGTVTDPTSASVPNATITVRNQNTGEERTTQSDANGQYVVPSLPVGTYRLEVKSRACRPRSPAIWRSKSDASFGRTSA